MPYTKTVMPRKHSPGEYFAIVLIGLAQIAAVGICVSFVFGAFELPNSCSISFEDDGLLFAQLIALILTTPWNLSKTLTTEFVFIVSAVLFLSFTTSIVIAENANEALRVCSETQGKRGAYSSIIWINLFSFLHTAVLWGYRIYKL